MASTSRRSLGALFVLLALLLAGIAVWAGLDRQWIVLGAAVVLAGWMADLAIRQLR